MRSLLVDPSRGQRRAPRHYQRRTYRVPARHPGRLHRLCPAGPRRSGQQRPPVCEGAVRIRVRARRRPDHAAHDSGERWLAAHLMDGGPSVCHQPVARTDRSLRGRFHRCAGLRAFHKRRQLPRTEVRAGGDWDEQRRLLCARLSRAERRRPRDHARCGSRAGMARRFCRRDSARPSLRGRSSRRFRRKISSSTSSRVRTETAWSAHRSSR